MDELHQPSIVKSLHHTSLSSLPSCIAFSKVFPALFVVGTYRLCEQPNGTDASDEEEHQQQQQSREGTLQLFRLDSRCAVHQLEEHSTPGILDVRFSSHQPHVAAAATSIGTIELWSLSAPHEAQYHLKKLRVIDVAPEDVQVLCLAWHPDKTREAGIAFSLSNGHVAVLQLRDRSPEKIQYAAHDYHAWTVAWSAGRATRHIPVRTGMPMSKHPSSERPQTGKGHFMYSGGDDNKIAAYDMVCRMPPPDADLGIDVIEPPDEIEDDQRSAGVVEPVDSPISVMGSPDIEASASRPDESPSRPDRRPWPQRHLSNGGSRRLLSNSWQNSSSITRVQVSTVGSHGHGVADAGSSADVTPATERASGPAAGDTGNVAIPELPSVAEDSWSVRSEAGRIPALEGEPQQPSGWVRWDTRTHEAGVTAILPLPGHDDQVEHECILTGSFDDHVRVLVPSNRTRWTTRAALNLGGGVWQLKLLRFKTTTPSPSTNNASTATLSTNALTSGKQSTGRSTPVSKSAGNGVDENLPPSQQRPKLSSSSTPANNTPTRASTPKSIPMPTPPSDTPLPIHTVASNSSTNPPRPSSPPSSSRRFRHSFLVLASCMHAGARILEVVRSSAGHWSIRVIARFDEHGSMNYASDALVRDVSGSPGLSLVTVLSTSFYDRQLAVWQVLFGDDPDAMARWRRRAERRSDQRSDHAEPRRELKAGPQSTRVS